jgi:hypothetical protein
MPTEALAELHEFHQFLSEKVTVGDTQLSPEEALDEWRRLHPQPDAFQEDVAAVGEALADVANGDRGIPFDEFDRDFRKRHNLPA